MRAVPQDPIPFHVPSSSLFGRQANLSPSETGHIAICRDCDLYSRLSPAVELADRFAQTAVPSSTPTPEERSQREVLRVILLRWARSYRTAAEHPGEWPGALRSLVSAVLFAALAKLALRERVAVEVDEPEYALVERSTPRRWTLRRRAALSSPRRHAADAIRGYWLEHVLAALRHWPQPDQTPDDSAATRWGFRRVVLPARRVAQFALLRTQPERHGRRDIMVFVPSLFLPAIAEKNLVLANEVYEKGLHVVIVDPVQAGATDWWSPGAPTTGGWSEGLDLATAIKDLREQLRTRGGRVWLVGTGLGATIALWAHVRAHEVHLDVFRTIAIAPVTNLGAIVNHLEPRRWNSFFDVWSPDFEIRAFYKLMTDERYSRGTWTPSRARGMRDYLAKAGVDPRDLGMGWSSSWHHLEEAWALRSTGPSIPGDLLRSKELRNLRKYITIFAGRNDPIVPFEHAERLAHALGLNIQEIPRSFIAPGDVRGAIEGGHMMVQPGAPYVTASRAIVRAVGD